MSTQIQSILAGTVLKRLLKKDATTIGKLLTGEYDKSLLALFTTKYSEEKASVSLETLKVGFRSSVQDRLDEFNKRQKS